MFSVLFIYHLMKRKNPYMRGICQMKDTYVRIFLSVSKSLPSALRSYLLRSRLFFEYDELVS